MGDLQEIKGVGEVTAEKLREGGYKTLEALAETTPTELSEKAGISIGVARKIVASAKRRTSAKKPAEKAPAVKPAEKPYTPAAILSDVLPALLEDYEVKEEISKKIAKEVSSLLKDDPILRAKVLEAAQKKPDFRSRVATYVAKELAD